MKNFRNRLREGELLISTLISFPSAEVVELLSKLGFDWLFIDAEHGPFDTLQMQHMLQAASTDCPCIVRVPSYDCVYIKKALDIGAAGIIVPQIKTAEETRAAVHAAKYAPLGTRGVGLARAHEYGVSFTDYLETANEQTCVVIQAETEEAIDNIDAITTVDGVDAVLIGPYDLSANLGYTGQIEHPEVKDAIKKVALACKKENVKLGYFGVSAEAVTPYIETGFTLITVGVDSLLLLNSAQQTLTKLRS